jgi:hypothetical protein
MASRTISLRRPDPAVALAVSCLAIALVLFALSPLATLWSVATGLQHDDVGAVRNALDWRSVRTGLKADFGGGLPVRLASASQVAPAEEELPGFGESFATTIVSHVVDDVVTPERVMAMLSQSRADENGRAGAHEFPVLSVLGRVEHLAFMGPARFEAAIRLSDDLSAEPVRISMRLERWQWKITRIHLPEQVLTGGGMSQTSNRT